MTSVQCPHCKKPVPWTEASPSRPFCSERCRLIDLGAWADGTYSIPTTESEEDADSLPQPNDGDESDENKDREIKDKNK